MEQLSNEKFARRILSRSELPVELDASIQNIVPWLKKLRGKVLEIGPGSGSLFSYFDSTVQYVGLEPNTYLHAVLQKSMAANGFVSGQVVAATAEQLPFTDSEFDAVVSVRTLCSMHDLSRALSEFKRVLKPGGIFVFAEHVAAPKGTWRRHLQQLLTPVWQWWVGCNPSVEIGPAIERAGFKEVRIEPFRVGGRRNVVVRLRIFGTAVKLPYILI